MPEIAIVGGGIGGLCCALSLAAAGMRATVYEATRDVRPLGAGINLLPHAVRELAELGLADELAAIGVPIERLTYAMQDGRNVWEEPRGVAAGYRWPQIAIHRGRLQMFLLDRVRAALGENAVRTGRQLVGIEGGRASFEDRGTGARETITPELLIGADGIHSAVRRHFYPHEGRPAWNGVSLFRSTTMLPAGGFDARMLWAGHAAQKFIAYPIAIDERGVQLNWVCDLVTGAPGSEPFEDWNRSADRDLLLDRFGGWKCDEVDVPAIIAASGEVFEFPMVDRDPLPRWSFGGVTLLGDAAHPMYPIGSNGATQAIIDGRVLAWHLASAPDLATGLARYEEERREATARIVLGNRAQGPDKVLELARERAADPAADIDTALPHAERAEIAASYKRLAGFDPAALNARVSYSTTTRTRARF